jgi:hypothetical protein
MKIALRRTCYLWLDAFVKEGQEAYREYGQGRLVGRVQG